MQFHKDEFQAPIEIRDRIVTDVLRPRLAGFEADLGFALPTELLCCAGSYELRIGVLTGSTDVAPRSPTGTARLRIRRTFHSYRFVYRIEAIYHLSHASGFSGFYLSGDVIQAPTGLTTKQTGFTVHYNNHQWQGWF
jgi:hypothetical protein